MLKSPKPAPRMAGGQPGLGKASRNPEASDASRGSEQVGQSGRPRSPGETQRMLLLVGILVLTAFATTLITMGLLYAAALREEQARLSEMAQNQARFIEVMVADKGQYRTTSVDTALSAVLDQLGAVQVRFPGLGKTGELTFSQREGDSIVFPLRHRYSSDRERPPVPWNSTLAAPSRRALSGHSGTMIGKDYRGATVLAAYEPATTLGLGIVAKIDLAEIRAPFVRAGLISLLAAIALICIGTVLFTRITNPVIRRLKEDEETFSSTFRLSPVPMTLTSFPDGKYRDVNDTFLSVAGFTRDEVIGRNSGELGLFPDPNDRARLTSEASKKGTVSGLPIRVRVKSGDTRECLISSCSISIRGQGYRLSSVLDVTELKRAETALRESESNFRTIFESNSSAMAVIERDTTISMVNQEYCRIGRYEEKDVIGLSWTKQVHPEDLERLKEYNRKRLTDPNSVPSHYEFRFCRNDGEIRHCLMSIGVLPVSQKFICSFVDITERKQAEERIRYLAGIVENVSEAIISSDAQYNIRSWNKGAEEMYGWHEAEVLGKQISEITRAEHVSASYDDVYRAVAESGSWKGEVVHLRKDGTPIYIMASITALYDSAEKQSGVVVIDRDITGLKQAEEALQRSETRYRRLFEAARDGILILNADTGRIQDANPFITEMLGYSRDELLGRELWEIGRFKDIVASQDRFSELRKKGYIRYADLPLQGKDGRQHDVEFVSNVYAAGNRKVVQCNIRDITERKQAETERERLTDDVHRKNQELEQILHAVSHDLRTPLVTVDGFAGELRESIAELRELVSAGGGPPETLDRLLKNDIPESIKYIESGTSRMNALLAGLLKYTRSGRAALKIEKLDMNRLVADVLKTVEFQIKESGTRAEVSDLPPCQGDAIQVGQVFANLLDNAIKYRDPGRPLAIRITGRPTGSRATYCVEDNGIGIPPEFREMVFSLFQRVRPGSVPGEGLGLAIVRRIADRLDGRVWLESELDKGSRFYVELPGP